MMMPQKLLAVTLLVFSTIAWFSSDGLAQTIVVNINGNPPQNPTQNSSTDSFGNVILWVDIAGTYDNGTVQIAPASTTGNPPANTAHVEVYNDAAVDYIALKNAKVTLPSSTRSVNAYPIDFYANLSPPPTATSQTPVAYMYTATGNFSGALTGSQAAFSAGYQYPMGDPINGFWSMIPCVLPCTGIPISFNLSNQSSGDTSIVDNRYLKGHVNVTLNTSTTFDYLRISTFIVQNTSAGEPPSHEMPRKKKGKPN